MYFFVCSHRLSRLLGCNGYVLAFIHLDKDHRRGKAAIVHRRPCPIQDDGFKRPAVRSMKDKVHTCFRIKNYAPPLVLFARVATSAELLPKLCYSGVDSAANQRTISIILPRPHFLRGPYSSILWPTVRLQ